MQVVFRTDANPTIGTGHLMRCRVLADALARRGARCLFLCRSEGIGQTVERITGGCHELRLLPEGQPHPGDGLAHSHWLPHGQARDAEFCRQALADIPRCDWLVVDHYALDHRWQQAMRVATGKLMVIDDLADRRHACDLLLDQNLHDAGAARYDSLLAADAVRLCGPRYALLGEGFAAHRPAALARRRGACERVLILFGGADIADLTGRTVDALATLAYAGRADVVTGPLYAAHDALRQRLARLPGAQLHRAPNNIADLMAVADLAVGSPGVTSWERCALGLPTIAIAVADNQEGMAESLARAGAHLYLGRAEQLSETAFQAALRLAIEADPVRRALSSGAAAMTDGRGAERVAHRLAGAEIGLRPARREDAGLLYAWRNDPRVRSQSFDPRPLERAEHEAWLDKSLANPGRKLLIGLSGTLSIGCLRFDIDDGEALVSIYLDPDRIGQGYAAPLLQAGSAWIAAHCPAVRTLRAEVRPDNAASLAAFAAAGYAGDRFVFRKAVPLPEDS